MLLKGLSAFPITPADASGKVDVSALRRLVAPLCQAGVDSIGLLGSTGSYPYLCVRSDAEHWRRLWKKRQAARQSSSALARSGLMRLCGLHRTHRWWVPLQVCSRLFPTRR